MGKYNLVLNITTIKNFFSLIIKVKYKIKYYKINFKSYISFY